MTERMPLEDDLDDFDDDPPSNAARIVWAATIAGAAAVIWWLGSKSLSLGAITAPGTFFGTGLTVLIVLVLSAPPALGFFRAAAAGAAAFLIAVLLYSAIGSPEARLVQENPAALLAAVLATGAVLGWVMVRGARVLRWHLVVAATMHASLTGIGARLQYADEDSSVSIIDQYPALLLMCFVAWAVSVVLARR